MNEVCKTLFAVLPDVASFAEVEIGRLEELIRPCGLFHTKAQNLKDAAVMLIEDFDGRVPDNMDDLLKIPGVGRKIANLLLGDLYGQPGHCSRYSLHPPFRPLRLGEARGKRPAQGRACA